MYGVVVDRVDLQHGFVTLSDGQVCEIVVFLDIDGDELDPAARDDEFVSAVLFEVPGIDQPFAIPLDRFHNPTVH